MALTSTPWELCINTLQNHYAFTKDCTYARKSETTIDTVVMAQGQTTADMLDTYNTLTPELISVWYIEQGLLDFGSGAVPPKAGDTVTAPDGTVYKVHQYEPQQDNVDWRLITVRERV